MNRRSEGTDIRSDRSGRLAAYQCRGLWHPLPKAVSGSTGTRRGEPMGMLPVVGRMEFTLAISRPRGSRALADRVANRMAPDRCSFGAGVPYTDVVDAAKLAPPLKKQRILEVIRLAHRGGNRLASGRASETQGVSVSKGAGVMTPEDARRFLEAAVRASAPRSGGGTSRALQLVAALTDWEAQFKAHRMRELGRREAYSQAQARGRPAEARRHWSLAVEDRLALDALLGTLEPLDRAKLRLVLAEDLHDLL